jgi:hypothetical protein
VAEVPIELQTFTAATLPLRRSPAAGTAEAASAAPVPYGETFQRQGRHLRWDISITTEAGGHRREDPRAAAAAAATGSPQNLWDGCRRSQRSGQPTLHSQDSLLSFFPPLSIRKSFFLKKIHSQILLSFFPPSFHPKKIFFNPW